jgi:hypothetical protein
MNLLKPTVMNLVKNILYQKKGWEFLSYSQGLSSMQLFGTEVSEYTKQILVWPNAHQFLF